MKTTLRHIPCKGCNAPLSLLGNSLRTQMLVCPFCGTVMDSRHEFRPLYAFTQIQQPATPLHIGMQGVIRQVPFTITGSLAYQAREAGWVQFQLYSPTHGYAQLLTWVDGYLFLRKTYYLPDRNLWTLKQGDSFQAHGQHFRIQHYHFAEIVHAEGSLTLPVKPRSRNKQCFAQAGDDWYVSIQQRDQVAYFAGQLLDADLVEGSFQLE